MSTASVTNTFVNATTADATEVNTNFTDLVTFLNGSVVHLDGSKTMTAALPMGSNKITGLANGTVSTDAAAFGQLGKTIFPITFGKTGAISATTTDSSRVYAKAGQNYTIDAVEAALRVDPLTTSVIVDVLINGTSVWNTTPANRPTITTTTNHDAAGALDTTAWNAGQYLQVLVDQADSGAEAEDLTVTIWVSEA